VGERVLRETVAVHLEQLFLRHGPPLVLKRDNGSNLNQQAVDKVLACYLVMPLNSPPHYPPHNGGMECAVRELKTPLVEKILAVDSTTESQVQAWAEVLAHELNHRSRACLDGHIACRVFQVSRQNRNVLISAKLKCPNLSKVESCAFRSLAANRRSP
jgi:transposase InsO family protein